MMSRAREEMPVRERKTQGSTMLVVVSSRVRKKPMSRSGGPQEEVVPTQTMSGRMSQMAVPM
jgi:hypothetical protein